MNLKAFSLMLAQAAENAAPGGTVPNPKAEQLRFFLLIGVMGLVMYFMMIRPQSKRAKEHEAMLKTLKAGDKVFTSGGVVGVVIAVKEKTVSLRSGDTKLEILKSAVAEVDRSGVTSES